MKKILLSLLMIQGIQCMKEPAPLTPDEKLLFEICKSKDNDDHEAVKQLIEEKEVNVNVTDEYGNTSAITAALNCRDKALLMLTEYGADLNTANMYGNTTAILAALNGSDQALLVLAEHNADLDKANKNGCTPARLASYWGHTNALKQLIKYNATLTQKNNQKQTPWDSAATQQIKDLLQFTQEPLLLKNEKKQEKEKTSQEKK